MDVDEVWGRFFADRSLIDRDELILHYRTLVERVARKQASSMPVPYEDLVGDGTEGLIDAIDKYDPARGVRFEVYAVFRIRGAIIDGVRAMDWVPRSVREKVRQVQVAYNDEGRRLNRHPSTEEVADRSGLSVTEVARVWNESRSVGSLQSVEHRDDVHAPELGDRLVGDRSPGDDVEITELRAVLADRLMRFEERERLMFTLYYVEGLTLAEIGTVVGVTEARVCQIHTRAMRDLCQSF